MKPVTDPAILEQLGIPVTDPNILAQLNSVPELITKPQRSGNLLSDALSQFNQGATFGLSDEAVGGVAALRNALNQGTIKNLGTDYDKFLGMQREYEQGFQEENPISSLALNVAGGIGASALGGIAGKALAPTATRGLAQYASQNPITTATAAGAGSGAAYGFGSGEGSLGDRAKEAASGAALGGVLGAAAGNVANRLGRAPVPTSGAIKQKAADAYKLAEKSGAILKPQFTNKFLGELEAMQPQSEAGRILAGDSNFTKISNKFKALKDKPLTLQAAQEIDEFLGDTIDSLTDVGRLTKQGKKVLDVQSTLRNMIDNASEAEIIGGREGFDSLKQGRKLWSQSVRLSDIERIIARAELSENPATAIKNGFKTILNNPNRIKGFNEMERKLIKSAAKSGIVSDTLKTIGSRLTGIITTATGSGGLQGSVLSNAAATASRNAATKLQVGKANKVAEIVANQGKKRAINANPDLVLTSGVTAGALAKKRKIK